MSIFSQLIAFLKGELSELAAEATAIEKKILPGLEASAKHAAKAFGEKALPIIEDLGAKLVQGLEAGKTAGSLIPGLVNEGVKDLAPELLDAGKNVLYTTANLILAEFLDKKDATTTEPAVTDEPAAASDGQAIN